MTDVTASRIESYPSMGTKEMVLRTGTTVTGATDTMTLTLADYGIERVTSVYVVVHTTDYSILVQESATSAVASGILTILTATGNDSCRRVAIVKGD